MVKFEYNVIGIMSGTSLDGIDIVEARFTKNESYQFKILHSETIPYTQLWKHKLKELVGKSKEELKSIDNLYSEYLAQTILTFIKKHNIEHLDFVASHGHTALHQPEIGITYQIGNLQILADILQQKVICDFRTQDVELGGQGAPLVPIGDQLLFGDFEYCLNLGGFANISFEMNDERIAFDICPVNIVLNHYVSKLNYDYDDRGKIARNGTLNNSLLEQLNKLDFYNEKPPKSLGLEWVNNTIFPLIDAYNLEVVDVLRTFLEHIAIQIAKFSKSNTKRVLVTGGGAYNDFLIERLKYFSEAKIIIPNKEIVEYKEALIFGLLGVLKVRNEINCLRSVTGAKNNHASGKILFPIN